MAKMEFFLGLKMSLPRDMVSPVPDCDCSRKSYKTVDDWVKVSILISLTHTEIASTILERFTNSKSEIEWPFLQGEDFGDAEFPRVGEARVSVYLPEDLWSSIEFEFKADLQKTSSTELSLQGSSVRLEITSCRRQDWETAWLEHLQVVCIGRLIIVPEPLVFIPHSTDVVVKIMPGLAFGTGQHQTTQMALKTLLTLVNPGDKVLDFGSGSGILACAAARLGAKWVDAVDVDPLAVEATKRNAALNGVSDVVHAWLSESPIQGTTFSDDIGLNYDIVVSNISTVSHVRHLAALASVTANHGTCILGGVTAAQRPRIERELTVHNLKLLGVETDGEWQSFRSKHDFSVSKSTNFS